MTILDRYRSPLRILAIGLFLWGFGLRLHGVLVLKQGLSHDESVTYNCASATFGDYQDRIDGMVDSALVVGDIQAFYARPTTFVPGRVAHDLALHDIHPPLYFWVLHALNVAFGLGIVGGALVNIIVELLVGWLMLLITYRVLGRNVAAWAALAIWYLSAAVVQVDLEARHYQFLAFFALASFILSERILTGRSTKRDWVLFTAVNALGLLTHFYFPFLLLPGAMMVLFRNGSKPPTLRYMASGLISLGLFLALFYDFFDFLDTYSIRAEANSEEIVVMDRLRTFVYAALAFFAEAHVLRYVYLVLILLLAGWSMYAVRSMERAEWSIDQPVIYYGILLVWTIGFTFAFYIVGLSPSHAVGEQYLSYFWPLFAIMIVYLLQRFASRTLIPVLGIHIALLTIALPFTIAHSEYVQRVLPEAWHARISESSLLITDIRAQSSLPRLTRDLPPTLPFVIMSKSDPELLTYRNIVFLHKDGIGRTKLDPFLARMADRGYTQVTEQHDHYQLILLQR